MKKIRFYKDSTGDYKCSDPTIQDGYFYANDDVKACMQQIGYACHELCEIKSDLGRISGEQKSEILKIALDSLVNRLHIAKRNIEHQWQEFQT